MESATICSNATRFGPITSLSELLTWQSTICPTQLQPVSTTCLSFDKLAGKFAPKNRNLTPKTLVCHDMKGGYLDDSYIGGCANAEAYNFTQWNVIDTFVYFSHHLVTIPPPCWVHAGHLHGVSVLGTFITEWETGSDICKVIFDNQESVDKLVHKLSSIAMHYHFDGWLINIENSVSRDKIPNVIHFLKALKQGMIQRGVDSAQLIWYDSITISGELKWQNELNEQNKIFFEACDGIFLNYTWDAECLKRSVTVAGDRILDTYVGIDVFGRNCYGGGGFNTRAALALVRQFGLSAAIFAPGWVYECHDIECFSSLNSKFWLLLFPHLSMKRLNNLPIETSFCPGYGKLKFRCGKVICKNPWFNMHQQQLQPFLSAVRGLVENSLEEFSIPLKSLQMLKSGNSLFPFGYQNITTDDAYNGGGCLALYSQEPESVFPLFYCDIPINGVIGIALALKKIPENGVSLVISATKTGDCELRFYQITVPIQAEANVTKNDDSDLPNCYCERFKPSEPSTDWITKTCKVALEDLTITGISLVALGPIDSKVGFFKCFRL